MNQLGTRISFKDYPKVVEEKSRRTLMEYSREFGRNITNSYLGQEKTNISTDTSCSKNPRKTILKIRSVSINGKTRVQLPKDQTTEYEKSILNTLVQKDRINARQKPLNVFELKLRALTLDWIIDIHLRLQLKDQTLYLFFQYFDEYCVLAEVEKTSLRKVALTCLWIAAKYEEVHPPKSSVFANITNGLIDKEEMKCLEPQILGCFQYNMIRTTPLSLANIVLGVRRGTQQESLCRYIFQLSYAYNLNSKYKASCLVITALTLVENIYKQRTEYRKYKEELGIENGEIVECFKDICVAIEKSSTETNIAALRKKFQRNRNHEVGKLKFEIKQLAQSR